MKKWFKKTVLTAILICPGLCHGQIHFSGTNYIEASGGMSAYLTPYANISYVHNMKKKQYFKIGVSYYRNTLNVLNNNEYSNIISLDVPYLFNIAGNQKTYLNVGAGISAGYEIAPDLNKYNKSEYRITMYDDRFLYGVFALVEGEQYVTPRSALTLGVKGGYSNSKITDFNVFFSIGYKLTLN